MDEMFVRVPKSELLRWLNHCVGKKFACNTARQIHLAVMCDKFFDLEENFVNVSF